MNKGIHNFVWSREKFSFPDMTLKDMLLIFGLYLGIVTYVNSLEKMLTLMKVRVFFVSWR